MANPAAVLSVELSGRLRLTISSRVVNRTPHSHTRRRKVTAPFGRVYSVAVGRPQLGQLTPRPGDRFGLGFALRFTSIAP